MHSSISALCTTVKFVEVLQVLQVIPATFAPVESYINTKNGTYRNDQGEQNKLE